MWEIVDIAAMYTVSVVVLQSANATVIIITAYQTLTKTVNVINTVYMAKQILPAVIAMSLNF